MSLRLLVSLLVLVVAACSSPPPPPPQQTPVPATRPGSRTPPPPPRTAPAPGKPPAAPPARPNPIAETVNRYRAQNKLGAIPVSPSLTVVAAGHVADLEATPAQALDIWRGSPAHHAMILNRSQWSDNTWQAMGAASSQHYAAVWFGEEPDR